jgi:antitoxin component YwqK of YwqJK toxin-antitoxin module
MKHFIIAVVVIIMVSCSRTSEKTEYNTDGTVKKKTIYTSSDKSAYREVEYYDGKRLKSVHEFVDGILHGRNFNYYPGGGIQSVFYYDMGRLTSIAQYYNPQGKLTDKGLFINDSLVVKEEYYYKDDMTMVNVFSRNDNDFNETGSLLSNNLGLFGMDNSHYYIVSSMDSIPADDSIKVDVIFISRNDKPSSMVLTLGLLNENLQFLSKERTYMSDSMAISFYYKPRNMGYNLILGKILHIKHDIKDQVNEFIFYHDFLAY